MKKKNIPIIHRISFWLLNITEFINILNFASVFGNEEKPAYPPKELIISIILFIFISIIYYSWYELYNKSFYKN